MDQENAISSPVTALREGGHRRFALFGGQVPIREPFQLQTFDRLPLMQKEIRRRTRVIGAFPDGYSAMMLVGASLWHISTTKWGTRHLNTCNLYEVGVQ